jgi:SAM-dependent methyltransferase
MDRRPPQEVLDHYGAGVERDRLAGESLERVRSEELLVRWLPPPPCRVLDVGGGPGRYASWLSERGYDVTLVDPVALHIEQARESAAALDRTFVAREGDARSLELDDGSVDVVLAMGPLYHLTDRDDRLLALREAARVLVSGGVVVAAGVGRLASLLDGLRKGYLDDEQFRDGVRRTLDTGEHRNPDDRADWFTTAYFHTPEELHTELTDAGFDDVDVVGVEGPGWLLPDVQDRLGDDRRDAVLTAARLAEHDHGRALSAHLLAFGRKP